MHTLSHAFTHAVMHAHTPTHTPHTHLPPPHTYTPTHTHTHMHAHSMCLTFDDPSPGLFVQSLHISFLTSLERGVDKALKEGQTGVFMELPSTQAILSRAERKGEQREAHKYSKSVGDSSTHQVHKLCCCTVSTYIHTHIHSTYVYSTQREYSFGL